MKVNLKKVLINVVQYSFFLAIGISLFMLVTKEFKLKDLFKELQNYNIVYVFIAIFFNILSNISRTLRWNLFLKPLGYKIKIFTGFLSINVMYLANFFIPRGGEVARCGIIYRTDDVPFSKAVGTVVIERTIDAFTLLLVSFIVFLTQISVLKEYLTKNLMLNQLTFESVITNIYVVIAFSILVFLVGFLIVFRKKLKKTEIYGKIRGFLKNIWEGVKSIKKVERPLALILHTLFIFFMWLLMMFTFFKGFPLTSHLGVMPVLTIFVLSSISMILPVPAGMGTFHFAVATGLALYGIDAKTVGVIISFIMHTSINVYLNLFGIISLIVFLFGYVLKLRNNTRSL